jgi:hypothetical protein
MERGKQGDVIAGGRGAKEYNKEKRMGPFQFIPLKRATYK